MGRRWTPRHTNPMGTISHSSVQLNISMEERTWLNNAWVGRLRNLVMFDRVEDELMWDRGEYITSKYLGDDMVLLLGLTDSKAEQLLGEVVEVDDDVEELQQLDRARVLIKTHGSLIGSSEEISSKESEIGTPLLADDVSPKNECSLIMTKVIADKGEPLGEVGELRLTNGQGLSYGPQDDTIFFGEALMENVKAIKVILWSFELVSGLKINFAKSSFWAVGMSDQWMKDAARTSDSLLILLRRVIGLKKRIKWKVECRTRVRFWEDGWREDGVPLMLKYPKLYINSYQQEQFIQQMGSLLDVSWEWRFQWRRLLFDAERHMAAKFLEDIEGITIYLDRWDK
ncbi:hypothetical protein HKD37_02G003375 [Glycine soja]